MNENTIREGNYSLVPTLKKCMYFLCTGRKFQIFLLLLLIIITGVAPSIDSIFLQRITDSIESYTDQQLKNTDLSVVLFKWVIIYVIWWESINLLLRVYDYAYFKILPPIKAGVMEELYDYVQYHCHDFFQSNLAGDISSRIMEASRSLEMVFAFMAEKIIRKLAILTFAIITLYTVNSTVCMIFFAWLVFFLGLSIYFAPNINHYSTLYSKDKAYVAGKLVDSISNISVIRMFSSHKFEYKYLKNHIDETITSDQNMQWFMLKLRYVQGLSCSLMMGGMIYYIIILRSNLEISIGQCVLIITLCISVIDNIWDLTQEFGDLFEQIGAFNQSMSLLDEHKIKDINKASTLQVESPSIEFKNVTFNYKRNNNHFNNQSIEIKPYQKIGLVGFSGSGKTTFVSMIARLYEVSSGQILIGGHDISKVSQDSLRQNISFIPQEPILFHRSIKDNIRYGNKSATEKEIVEAAKAAHIHDLIISMPNSYDTICGERGNNFSGGQRQRIIIARAFLKNAPILILDEATSSLDSYTEELINSSLQNLMKGKTTLIIAHRLSTIKNVDRILVFDKGSIIADGSHQKLKNESDLYKKLWKSFGE